MGIVGLTLIGDWKKFEGRLDAKARQRVLRASDIGTKRAALFVQKMVRQEIRAGSFVPNAPMTIALKGSTKPLVDKGRLFQSVSIQRQKRATFFVGIKLNNKVHNIGRVLHDGTTIKVTAKMRALFKILWYVTKRAAAKSSKRQAAAEQRKQKAQKLPSWENVRPAKKLGGPGLTPWDRVRPADVGAAKKKGGKKGGQRRDPLAMLKSSRARELACNAIRKGIVIRPIGKNTAAIRIPARPFIRNVIERRSIVAQARKIWEQAISSALSGREAA